MSELLEFGRGPLFKFSFAIMILGLARIVLLSLYGVAEALYRAGDPRVNWREVWNKTKVWLFPMDTWANKRAAYSAASIIFHVGLIIVPLLLAAHIQLWRQGIGFGWPAIPQFVADLLTLAVIVTGPALFLGRLFHAPARAISRKQDYIWPLLLTVPALSGFLCANFGLSAGAYLFWMVVHVYAANLIMILMPFTKIAHCILMPITQLVSTVGWKFPVGSGDKVAGTLGKRGQPV